MAGRGHSFLGDAFSLYQVEGCFILFLSFSACHGSNEQVQGQCQSDPDYALVTMTAMTHHIVAGIEKAHQHALPQCTENSCLERRR